MIYKRFVELLRAFTQLTPIQLKQAQEHLRDQFQRDLGPGRA